MGWRHIVSRRAFLRLGAAGAAAGLGMGWAMGIEPTRLVTRRPHLTDNPRRRIVHFTDTHHKGDTRYLRRVVARINDLDADFVCFTGDIVEDRAYLEEALDILAGVNRPMFGVPGNHDYWSQSPFAPIHACFESTGGRWLVDEACEAPGGGLTIVGRAERSVQVMPLPEGPTLFLTHYPETVAEYRGHRFELALAGHSHGGQVRIPFYGPLIVPGGCGPYDMGLYDTPQGPLFVSAGIGTWYMKLRLFCPPDVALIAL